MCIQEQFKADTFKEDTQEESVQTEVDPFSPFILSIDWFPLHTSMNL